MNGPPTIQVNGTTVRVCGNVTAGESVTITVVQNGTSTQVYQHTQAFPATRRECHTFTLENGVYDVNIVSGDYEYDFTITVPDVPSVATLMTPNPNNPPEGPQNPGPG